jgi:hypothetical protein
MAERLITSQLTIAEPKPAPIEIENQEDKPPNTSVYDNNFMVSDKTLFLTLAKINFLC